MITLPCRSSSLEAALCIVTTTMLTVYMCLQGLYLNSIMMLFITYTAYQVEHPSINTHYNARSSLSSGILLGSLSLPWLCSMTTMKMYNAIALASIMQIAVIIKFQHRADRLKWRVGTIAITLFWSVIIILYLLAIEPMNALSSSSVHSFIILPLMVVVLSCSLVLAILHYFPRTFTIGEAMVVAQGLAVLLVHWNTTNTTNVPSPMMVIVGSTLSTIMVLTVWHIMMGNNRVVDTNRKPSPASSPPLSSRTLVLLTIFISATFTVSSALQYLSFIVLSPRRILIVVYWAAVLVFNLPIMYLLAHGTGGGSTSSNNNRSAPPPPPPSPTIPNIILRKGYHLLACVLFLPPILLKEVDMLSIGLAIALSVLMLVEVVRVTEVPIIGPMVHRFMASFIDERDKGVVFTTHLTLLVGMAVPIWITPSHDDGSMLEREMLVSGIVIIGIGDAVASVVGSLVGRATRQLQRIGLDDNLLRRLCDKNILTARDLFSRTLLDLVELLDLPYHTVHLILAQVAAKITPAPCTALDMLQSSLTRPYTHLPTGLPLLDSSLHGGIPAGSITEIVGPAGLGKTQFCLTLSIIAVQAGGVVMYIDTEKKVSAERLLQIAQARSTDDDDDDTTLSSLLERVMLICPPDSASLLNQLNNLESTIIDHKVSFIVIDSIASLARADSHTTIPDRQRMLGQQAAQLKYLAETFGIPVLVVNQVTTMINNNTNTTSGSDDDGGGSKLVAALGPTWAHAVNTRLEINLQSCRMMKIVKSPASPAVTMAYAITTAGVVEHVI